MWLICLETLTDMCKFKYQDSITYDLVPSKGKNLLAYDGQRDKQMDKDNPVYPPLYECVDIKLNQENILLCICSCDCNQACQNEKVSDLKL